MRGILRTFGESKGEFLVESEQLVLQVFPWSDQHMYTLLVAFWKAFLEKIQLFFSKHPFEYRPLPVVRTIAVWKILESSEISVRLENAHWVHILHWHWGLSSCCFSVKCFGNLMLILCNLKKKGTPDIRSVPALLFLFEDPTIVKPQVYLKGFLLKGFMFRWNIFCFIVRYVPQTKCLELFCCNFSPYVFVSSVSVLLWHRLHGLGVFVVLALCT